MGAVPPPLFPLRVRASKSFVCHIVTIFSDSNMVETPGGGGGTLIFAYIRKLRSFFWVQNFEFQYFWGFSEK